MQQTGKIPARRDSSIAQGATMKLAALIGPIVVSCRDVRLAGLRPCEFAAVIGCGPIGLLTAMAARDMGAKALLSGVIPRGSALARARNVLVAIYPAKPSVDLFQSLWREFRLFDTRGYES